MLIKNTTQNYGIVAILFHWIMAILIIGMLALGLYMTGLPKSLEKFQLIGWHKEYGILILMLAVLRVAWRLSNLLPSLTTLPTWERLAARLTHFLLYVAMFIMPLTGWMMSSAAGYSVSFFGLFTLPDLIGTNKDLAHTISEIHEYTAYALIALIILHVLAALKHYWIDKDNIMQRMLSSRSN
ncbi:MAG: cytochrome b [Gammaproteobacteria bacterium]|nr:MAG: cytochrome b [Gammaproteobacteria bacterium]